MHCIMDGEGVIELYPCLHPLLGRGGIQQRELSRSDYLMEVELRIVEV